MARGAERERGLRQIKERDYKDSPPCILVIQITWAIVRGTERDEAQRDGGGGGQYSCEDT